MAHIAFADSRAYRFYDVELPYRVSGFLVGIGISKFKQIGVWDKFPRPLKTKLGLLRGVGPAEDHPKGFDWIPDDAWEKTAVILGVKWKYAPASKGFGGGVATSVVQREPGSNLTGVSSKIGHVLPV